MQQGRGSEDCSHMKKKHIQQMLGDKWVTSLGEWVNKLVFTHEVEYYSGKKKTVDTHKNLDVSQSDAE